MHVKNLSGSEISVVYDDHSSTQNVERVAEHKVLFANTLDPCAVQKQSLTFVCLLRLVLCGRRDVMWCSLLWNTACLMLYLIDVSCKESHKGTHKHLNGAVVLKKDQHIFFHQRCLLIEPLHNHWQSSIVILSNGYCCVETCARLKASYIF